MTHVLAAGADPVAAASPVPQLVTAAIVGIVVIIALITWLKVHPFIALTIGAVGVGIGAGLAPTDAITSFGAGFGSTMTSVGILVGLGAMFGKLLVDSGAADRIVDTLVRRSSPRTLPWTMALIGALIGLPMFFEVGLVLLIPIIVLVAKRSGVKIMRIAVPALVGLSTMHAFVPPHPGPLVAVSTVGANLGLTLAFGIALAIPVVILSGPVFSRFAARWVDIPAPDLFGSHGAEESERPRARERHTDVQDPRTFTQVVTTRHSPSFAVALIGVLLPVVLMLAQAIREATLPRASGAWVSVLDFLGTPMVAIGIAAIYGMIFFAIGGRMDRNAVSKSLNDALPPIAGVLLIVGAGGGFKQVLIDTGIGTVIADAVKESGISVLLVAWVVAALVRVATGSATVATVTAAGIMAPIAHGLSTPETSLLVLAIGAGSVFLSHVNDAGFWLVKSYFNMTVGQTFKTWSVLECLISLFGLGGVMLAGVFIS